MWSSGIAQERKSNSVAPIFFLSKKQSKSLKDTKKKKTKQKTRYDSCWPALAQEINAVVLVYNQENKGHERELENW
jgi:hypothetical protein